LQRDYSSGSLYDYYTRHDDNDASANSSPSPGASATATPLASASPSPHAPSGPAVKTAAGRVFYGGGGITPDIDSKPLIFTPLKNRVAEAAFQFTRQLAAGLVTGLESYKVEKVQYGRNAKPGDYAINERVLEAFRAFVRNDTESQLTNAQIDEELDFAKLRLREEIVTAAYSNDAGARVLLDSDPQVLRALEALPDAKRLAEATRNETWQG
jgi:hypothetical protein